MVNKNLALKILEDNEFGKLGFYSLGVIYVFFAGFSFNAATIVGKLGDKCSLIVGGLCYVAYGAAFNLPAMRIVQSSNQTL